MSSKADEGFRRTLVVALAAGIFFGPAPLAAVGALAALLAYDAFVKALKASRRFESVDEAIAALRTDFTKIKEKADKHDLAAAFKPRGQ